MENAGLITYREVALLLDPATAPLSVQKRVAEVVTHELAHQWFGNWVTMVWWDDLWLNEAFATWMAYKIVERLAPRLAGLARLRRGQGHRPPPGRAPLHPPHPRHGGQRRRGHRELRRHHLREGRRGPPDDRGLPRRGGIPLRHPRLHAQARAGERRRRRPVGRARPGLARPGGGAGQRVDSPERLPGGERHARRQPGASLAGALLLRARSRRLRDLARAAGSRLGRRPGATHPDVSPPGDDGRGRARDRGPGALARRERRLDRLLPRGVLGRAAGQRSASRSASFSRPSASACSPISGRWYGPVARASRTSSTWCSPSATRPTTPCSTSSWAGWLTSRRGSWTARTRSGSAGSWSGCSSPGCSRWAGIRWPARPTRTGSDARRSSGRWRAWRARSRCSPRQGRGWTVC